MFPSRGNLAVVFLLAVTAATAAADQHLPRQHQAAIPARDAAHVARISEVVSRGKEEEQGGQQYQYDDHSPLRRSRSSNSNPIRDVTPRVSGDGDIHIGINDPAPDPNAPEEPPANDAIATIMAISPTLSSATTALASLPTAASSSSAPASIENDNPTECRLLGSFAILVQLALGGLALLSLVYKRWRERPQRPVKIWFFDVSKQVFGSVLVHAANVFMSLLTSGRFNISPAPEATVGGYQAAMMVRRGLDLVGAAIPVVGSLLPRAEDGEGPYVPNPCSFYLLNLGIDTTLGIPILILIVRVTTKLVSHTPLGNPPESIQSGNYGNPPNAWWWLKQSIIYFCGLMGMKLVVLVIFMLFPWISRVGDWALGWTEGNEKLQIVFVMMLFPLIMNAMQYYIIDSYIKKQIAGGDSDAGSETERGSVGSGTAVAGGHGGVSYGVISASDSDDDSDAAGLLSDDEEERLKKGRSRGHQHPERVRLTRRDSSKDREYDPTIDGDSGTVVESSSSRASPHHHQNQSVEVLLPKELIPHA